LKKVIPKQDTCGGVVIELAIAIGAIIVTCMLKK